MNERQPKIGDMVRSISADRLLASVGIGILLDSETLFNDCDDSDAAKLVEISNELYLFSSLLAALCTQHERTLKALTVDLPEDIGAIVVENPLYEPETKDSSADAEESISETGDNFPF